MAFEIIILVYTDEGQYMKGQNLVEKNQRGKKIRDQLFTFLPFAKECMYIISILHC